MVFGYGYGELWTEIFLSINPFRLFPLLSPRLYLLVMIQSSGSSYLQLVQVVLSVLL